MLNYIWAAFIIISLIFALIIDVGELVENRFRNDVPLPATVRFEEDADFSERRVPAEVVIDSVAYQRFYDTDAAPDSAYSGVLVQTQEGRQLQFGADQTLPEPLGIIQVFNQDEEGDPLRTTRLREFEFNIDSTVAATGLVFNPTRFRKLRDISQAALDFAETAAEIALGLIGILALFLGLLHIGEEAGLIYALTSAVQPILRPLFPDIPKGHPAIANISLNLLANVFGLGNAATPLGIKAMEELQRLNPSDDTATDSMVMLLAINTSSVQLVPPVLLIAVMGLQINQLIFAIILATSCATVAGILAAKGFSKMRTYRRSNPLNRSDTKIIGGERRKPSATEGGGTPPQGSSSGSSPGGSGDSGSSSGESDERNQ